MPLVDEVSREAICNLLNHGSSGALLQFNFRQEVLHTSCWRLLAHFLSDSKIERGIRLTYSGIKYTALGQPFSATLMTNDKLVVLPNSLSSKSVPCQQYNG